ncbi:MAG: hypothetical protein AAF411_19785 [Myxococcota bacterium]
MTDRPTASLSLLLAISALGCGTPLSADQLNSVVEAERGSLEECSDDQTRELEARIHVDASGRVLDVRASGAPRAAACVERIIGAWEFPAATAEVKATLPVTLTARPTSDLPD